MVGWALIGVALRFHLWLVVCLVAILGILWLYRLRRATGQRRTWTGTILRIFAWAASSLLAWVVLYLVVIVVATLGAGVGLWGSPWDGR